MRPGNSRIWFLLLSFSLLSWMGCSGDGDDDSSSPTPSQGGESPTPGVTPDASFTPSADADSDGYPASGGDCDDADAAVHPDATEIPYDGIDQDCRDGDLTDVDGDGYDSSQVAGGSDCDDHADDTYPGGLELGDGRDNDCDGRVDEDLDSHDDDGDGYSELMGDCDDADASLSPGAAEVPYDGIDQDCSGTDQIDVDGDSYSGAPGLDGAPPADCDDLASSTHPNAQEVPYDGIDQDCNGRDLIDVDGDGYSGAPGPDGSPAADCDDHDTTIYRGATDTPYDGIDQDCSGADVIDADGDGQSAVEAGGQDCQDRDDSVYVGAQEVAYDGIDQDCSGADLTDIDGDGYVGGPAGSPLLDCDDSDPNSHPGATEYADGKDNNCDGKIDNELNTSDDDGDGASEAQGDCNDGSASIHPGATEVPYDGIDQDCSGADLTDVDGDGYAGGKTGGPAPADCNDKDPKVHPGATDVPYDAIDQDCSGKDLTDVDGDAYDATAVAGGKDCNDQDKTIHPGAKDTPYDGIDQDCSGKDLTDVDGDGYDATAVSGGKDCNDADAAIHPGAQELCDQIDNNCDNVVDSDAVDRKTWYMDGDHDGYGDPGQPVLACKQTDSLVTDHSDCDDRSAANHPGAVEVCDTADNDCDGQVDEGLTSTFYPDADGDGYGNPAAPTQACSRPAGYVTGATDCDDTRASSYPGAREVCNGLDDSCDGQIDEDVKTTFYLDADEDGYGNPQKSTQACTVPAGYAANNTDCKDTNDQIHPGVAEQCNGLDDNCDGQIDEDAQTLWYQDLDKDGYGNASISKLSCSQPAGYVANAKDCNDAAGSINPGVTELCNGLDDNCNNQIDEGVVVTYYLDSDGDGYGDPSKAVSSCSPIAGYVKNATDCDDSSSGAYPGAKEVCNELDDNCNGVVDEGLRTTWYQDADGDGFGTSTRSVLACTLPPGYASSDTDCDDANVHVNPAALEACNALDDNCNGVVDENVKTTFYQDADGDGFGNAVVTTQACSAPVGYVVKSTDCNDAVKAINPGASEACNGVDDNCNGVVDEGVKVTYYQDADVDGYGNPAVTTVGCSPPAGYVAPTGDCNDADKAINPGATETANAKDDNCDGQIDEGVSFISCKDLKTVKPSTVSGTYQIDPDGPTGPNAAFTVYCDMSTDGGGWTMVLAARGGALSFMAEYDTWTTRTDATADAANPLATSSQFSKAFYTVKGSDVLGKENNNGYVLLKSAFSNETWRQVYALPTGSAWPALPGYQRQLTITSKTVTNSSILAGCNYSAASTYSHWYVFARDTSGDTFAFLTTGMYTDGRAVVDEADQGFGANENGAADGNPYPPTGYASGAAYDIGGNATLATGWSAVTYSLFIR